MEAVVAVLCLKETLHPLHSFVICKRTSLAKVLYHVALYWSVKSAIIILTFVVPCAQVCGEEQQPSPSVEILAGICSSFISRFIFIFVDCTLISIRSHILVKHASQREALVRRYVHAM